MKTWTPDEDEEMRRLYPSYNNADLAFLFGCTVPAVNNRATKLGLHKTPEYMAMHSGRIRKGNIPRNKGITGVCPAGCEKGWFKKGGSPVNTRPIGALRYDKGGNLQRKINNNPGNNSVRWRCVHELVWIEHNGPVPEKHIVVFKPGMWTNVVEQITPDRVECISLAENMRRNTKHNYGKEIADLMAVRAALNRRINAAVKEAA